MNEADRKKRDREIELLFLAGSRPIAIASLYDLQPERVRRILHELGYEIDYENGQDKPNHFWDQPTHLLRERIWQRQRDGARQALKSYPH